MASRRASPGNDDEWLTNNVAPIERLFREYAIRIEYHFHRFLQIGPCFVHGRTLCVCAGQLLDKRDVPFRHFFKDSRQLHCHDYSLPLFYIRALDHWASAQPIADIAVFSRSVSSAIFDAFDPIISAASRINSDGETIFFTTEMKIDAGVMIFFGLENTIFDRTKIVSGASRIMSG